MLWILSGQEDIKRSKIICNTVIPRKSLNNVSQVPKVTIIVITSDSTKSIRGTLDSIAHLDYPLNSLELLVVDGQSVKNIEQEIFKFNEEHAGKISARHIKTEGDHGFGKAINLGMNLISSDAHYLLVVKSDCRFFNDTLNRLISSALATEDLGFRLWECRQVPHEHPKYYNPVTLETTWSSFACCLIEKAAFAEIAGFDEKFGSYLEEVDLSWRIRMEGYRLRYVPSARIFYDPIFERGSSRSSLNNSSLIDGFYLRYKYGSFLENIKYRKQFWYLVISSQKCHKIDRKKIIIPYMTHFWQIPSAFAFKLKKRRNKHHFTPLFVNFNFEQHRLQASLPPCIEESRKGTLPTVSIIVRTIGKEGFLREALSSIRNQTYPYIEVVVVEDGPATVQEMVQSEFRDLNLKYFPLGENHGRSYAGNFGMEQSTGKYLRFLDEDDLLFADSVERAVCVMLQNPKDAGLVYDLAYVAPTDVLSEDPFQYREYDHYVFNNENFRRATLFSRNLFPIQCALFDRDLKEACGGFDESLDALEDWDLWIRYSMKTEFFMVPEVTSIFRIPHDPNAQARRREGFDPFTSILRKRYPGGYCTLNHSDLLSEHHLTSASGILLTRWRWHRVKMALKKRLDAFITSSHAKISFPAYDDPRVSIIMRVANKAEYTFHCLENILAHADIPFEIILLDYTSDDITDSLLEKTGEIKILSVSSDQGFSKGYILGAEMAKGKYLLFLESDTVVPPDWLSVLVNTLEAVPQCGAVGCKVVSHGGTLREAGGIIWADGSVASYGNKGNSDNFAYNYLRSVDCCSRIGLLTLKDMFLELKGYDDEYCNEPYEDADYCMKLQSKGYSVWYQPAVTMFDLEFMSRDRTNPAYKTKREKFVHRWAHQLKDHSHPGFLAMLMARDKRQGKRILVIDSSIPIPSRGVGFPRAYNIYRGMAENGYIVTLFPIYFREALQPTTREFQQSGIEVVYDYHGSLDEFLNERNIPYDLVVVSRPEIFSNAFDVIRKHYPKVPILYDTEALYSIRTILRLETEGKTVDREKRKKCMETEIALLNKADLITVVSEHEKSIAIENGLMRPVRTLGYCSEVRDPVPDFDQRKGILFLGSFLVEDGPNTDAILYFVNNLFPDIARALHCTLYIVGYNSIPLLSFLQSEDIIIVGGVDKISDYYDMCRVFIVPHQYAAGIPIKLSEAMSNGVPSVVSKIIADQFSLTDRKEVMIGASDGDFISSVIHLYRNRDLWIQIQQEGYEFIKRTHDPLQFRQELFEIVENALERDHE